MLSRVFHWLVIFLYMSYIMFNIKICKDTFKLLFIQDSLTNVQSFTFSLYITICQYWFCICDFHILSPCSLPILHSFPFFKYIVTSHQAVHLIYRTCEPHNMAWFYVTFIFRNNCIKYFTIYVLLCRGIPMLCTKHIRASHISYSYIVLRIPCRFHYSDRRINNQYWRTPRGK